jgi:hypothetical protein
LFASATPFPSAAPIISPMIATANFAVIFGP